MRYQCQVSISAPLDEVVQLFLEHMVRNEDKSAGSVTTFTTPVGEGQEMVMKETIESNHLPDEMVTIYEVDGVWNRCINQFKTDGNQVIYLMDTEFVFETEMPVSEDVIRNKTQSQMEYFKTIVEKE